MSPTNLGLERRVPDAPEASACVSQRASLPKRVLRRAGRWVGHALVLSAAFVPFSICLFGGAATTSLWLDEILYRYLELDRALRAHEFGKPASIFMSVLGKDVYCDVRLALGQFLEWTHISSLLGVEASMRLPAFLAFLASTLLIYVAVLRRTGSIPDAATAASLFSTLPVCLRYAFEARSYSPNTLVALAFVLAASAARRSRGAALGAAVLGVVAVLFHWWAVCLPSAIALLVVVEVCRSRRLDGASWRLIGASLPAMLLAGIQAFYVIAAPGAGGAAFPLFRPRGFRVALVESLSAPWIGLWSRPTYVTVLTLAFFSLLAVLAWRRDGGAGDPLLRRVGPIAVLGAVVVGAVAGNIVFSRHLSFLIAVMVLGLGLATGRVALFSKLALIALNIGFLPGTYEVVTRKGNGRVLAEIVGRRGEDLSKTAVVVQQGLVLGYPDPLNSFGLDFYLNGPGPGPRVPLFELPALEDVAGRRGVFEYFSGGEDLLARSASRPVERWDAWLRTCRRPVLWFVAPVAGTQAEADQQAAFRRALERSGYRPGTRSTFLLTAYPTTTIGRFERRQDP